MEFNENIPIYLQIIAHVEKQILTNHWSAGKKIPSVRELSKELQVNPGTVQKAYADLEQRQILLTLRGIGKQVTVDQVIIDRLREKRLGDSLEAFCHDMKELNLEKKTILDRISATRW